MNTRSKATDTTHSRPLAIGDRVTWSGKDSPGEVVAIGHCGYGRCRHGERCVTVRPDGHSLTLNFAPDALERIEP